MIRTCRWCGGDGSPSRDKHGRWYYYCHRCHRETERFLTLDEAREAWGLSRLHVPPHRNREATMAKIVSPEPFQVEVIEDKGKELIRMYAWCMVDMTVSDARRLIMLLEDAIKQVDMETSETEQVPA